MKDSKLIRVLLFIVVLFGLFFFSYFYQKASYSKQKLAVTKDSLNQLQNGNLLLTAQKTNEAYEVEAIRNAPTTNPDFFIEKLFSNESNDIRKAAQTMLLRNFKEDPSLVPNLLTFALDGRVNDLHKKSLWRTVYILTRLPEDLLAKEETLVQDFFRAMFDTDFVGKNTRMDMDSIVEKIIQWQE